MAEMDFPPDHYDKLKFRIDYAKLSEACAKYDQFLNDERASQAAYNEFERILRTPRGSRRDAALHENSLEQGRLAAKQYEDEKKAGDAALEAVPELKDFHDRALAKMRGRGSRDEKLDGELGVRRTESTAWDILRKYCKTPTM